MNELEIYGHGQDSVLWTSLCSISFHHSRLAAYTDGPSTKLIECKVQHLFWRCCPFSFGNSELIWCTFFFPLFSKHNIFFKQRIGWRPCSLARDFDAGLCVVCCVRVWQIPKHTHTGHWMLMLMKHICLIRPRKTIEWERVRERVSKSCSYSFNAQKCAAMSFLHFYHFELNIFRLSFKPNEERKGWWENVGKRTKRGRGSEKTLTKPWMLYGGERNANEKDDEDESDVGVGVSDG